MCSAWLIWFLEGLDIWKSRSPFGELRHLVAMRLTDGPRTVQAKTRVQPVELAGASVPDKLEQVRADLKGKLLCHCPIALSLAGSCSHRNKAGSSHVRAHSSLRCHRPRGIF